MRRILIILLLALVAIVIFAGCNNSNDAETTVAATETDVTTEESTTSTPDGATSSDTTDTEASEDTTDTESSKDTTEYDFIDGTTGEEIISGEEPLAPVEGCDMLAHIPQTEWNGTPSAPMLPVLIRTAEEFSALELPVDFELDDDFSFDTHSLIVLEYNYNGSVKIVDLYGFDVVDGKICPIIRIEKLDPSEICECLLRDTIILSVSADSIAGALGPALTVNPDSPIYGIGIYHPAYRVSAPSRFDWCTELGSIEPKGWNYHKDAVLIRSQAELDSLGISQDIDFDEPFSFEENWLVLICFRMSTSDKIIGFYGFDVVDGEICPIITVETPDIIEEVICENFLLVSIPANSVSGKMGDLLANNLLNSAQGSAYQVRTFRRRKRLK